MKVSNIEKFRNDLFKNLEDVFFMNARRISETYFKETEENKMQVTHLYDTLEIKTKDVCFYILVDDDDADVTFWKVKPNEKYFRYMGSVDADLYRTQCSFQMEVAVRVAKAMK